MNMKKSAPKNGVEKELPTSTKPMDGLLPLNFQSETIDQIRYLVTRVQREGSFPQCLSMVSSLRGEGVSYLSLALAVTLAHDYPAQVCMVDLNWYWPSSLLPQGTERQGLNALLQGEASLDDVLVPTVQPNLMILPAGNVEKSQRPSLARSQELNDLINSTLRGRFQYIILDIPAICATSDSVPLAKLADGCCMVIRQGATSEGDVRAALDEISHINVLGAILNEVRYATPSPLVRLIQGKG
jgi:Mrp family chromosome partitioning ATPase